MSGVTVTYRPARPAGWDPGLVARTVAEQIDAGRGPTQSAPGQDPAETIAGMVIGSRRERPGRRPGEANLRLIRERIDRFVRERRPIEARLVWVPKKRARTGAEAAPDLCEALALARLAALDRRVRGVHPPGLHYNVFLVDFEGLYIEGDRPEVREAMDVYCGGLRDLAAAAGWDDAITLIRVSETGSQEDRAAWAARLRDNHDKLLAYWTESEARGLEGYEAYASYAELRRIGWRGSLPKEARAHFLARTDGLTATASPEERLDLVLRNFSASLLHHQVMILKTPGGAPLNLSFTPPAPRIPGHLLKARIDLLPYLPGVASTSAPPWADKAWVEWADGRPRVVIRGWREACSLREHMVPGVLDVGGRGRSVRLRADHLPSGAGLDGRAPAPSDPRRDR